MKNISVTGLLSTPNNHWSWLRVLGEHHHFLEIDYYQNWFPSPYCYGSAKSGATLWESNMASWEVPHPIRVKGSSSSEIIYKHWRGIAPPVRVFSCFLHTRSEMGIIGTPLWKYFFRKISQILGWHDFPSFTHHRSPPLHESSPLPTWCAAAPAVHVGTFHPLMAALSAGRRSLKRAPTRPAMALDLGSAWGFAVGKAVGTCWYLLILVDLWDVYRFYVDLWWCPFAIDIKWYKLFDLKKNLWKHGMRCLTIQFAGGSCSPWALRLGRLPHGRARPSLCVSTAPGSASSSRLQGPGTCPGWSPPNTSLPTVAARCCFNMSWPTFCWSAAKRVKRCLKKCVDRFLNINWW